MRYNIVTDHKGNVYSTKTEVAKLYDVSITVMNIFLERGYTVSDMTEIVSQTTFNSLTYPSYKVMAISNKVDPICYLARRRHGYTLEESLTSSILIFGEVIDVDGVIYTTYHHMCAVKNVSRAKSYNLLSPTRNSDYLSELTHLRISHNKKVYSNATLLARECGISLRGLTLRLKGGYTLEEAMTLSVRLDYCSNTQRNNSNPIKTVDHAGNVFNSVKDMYNFYHIPLSLYHYRCRLKMTLEEILTTPIKAVSTTCLILDNQGKRYESVKMLCDDHNIPYEILTRMLRTGMDFSDCLKILELDDYPNSGYDCLDDLLFDRGIDIYTYLARRRSGLTPEQSLENKILLFGEVTGDNDIVYLSLYSMCKKRRIPFAYAKYFTKSAVVTHGVNDSIVPRVDFNGNIFSNSVLLLNHYNQTRRLFLRYLSYGLSIKEALSLSSTAYHSVQQSVKSEAPNENITCTHRQLSSTLFDILISHRYTFSIIDSSLFISGISLSDINPIEDIISASGFNYSVITNKVDNDCFTDICVQFN